MGREAAPPGPQQQADQAEPRAREQPGWDRRHPDFEPGNMIAVQHGINSPRLMEPVAEAIKREILADRELPGYLRQPQFRYALDAYCWAEARCVRIRAYLEQLEFGASIEERTETDEDESRWEGGASRKSVSRRIESAHELARKYETLASNQRSKLGLDPASAAKLGRNLAAAKLDIAQVMAQMAAEEGDGRRSA
jgi:hypothetical protein